MSFEKGSFAAQAPGYQCRVCLEKIEEKQVQGVTTPCRCAGSVKLIHVKCLKEWVKAKGSVQCEICHSLYTPQWI